MKLDIGCGPKCLPGFVGVDRFPMPGVQVLADLDKPLPFEDNSVELVHAAHSLEHVSDLMFTMREIYRVCKHKAQVCIVVPYYEQKLNLANPYHLQVFNEHTPRFWSSCSWAPIDKKEYYHPHAVTWGLSQSDNSNPGLEIRLLRMEFFYFPRFNQMDPSCKRELRQHLTDVCHQVVYHLVVWKEDNEADYLELTKNLDTYPFLDTPALQKSRADAECYEAESFSTVSYAEEVLGEKLKEQHDYVVECERKLIRNEKLIELLTTGPDIPESDLKRFDKYLATNYHSREPRNYRLGKEIPSDGYVEYQVTGTGLYNSISVCVYLSADNQYAQMGIELVDKNNNIVWSSLESLSEIGTIGVVKFSLDKSLKQEDLACVRFFGRNLNICAKIVECSVVSPWPLRPSKLVPYACFSNDE
ncbi:class I SAM-dependent methyltransferase [Pseudomonas fluorescens]|uniref:class I SAM-dependent methyltransferase n=1 Tax=Pseudomonas fluorescens TaxID=294 RepID=UPI000F4683E7|nr:class I SAM-dependent methyltransferase [Pseudomonas fluorescens]